MYNYFQAEGELANSERLSSIIQRMAYVGGGQELTNNGEQFQTFTIAFPSYTLVVSRQDQQLHVIKKPAAPESFDLLKEVQQEQGL